MMRLTAVGVLCSAIFDGFSARHWASGPARALRPVACMLAMAAPGYASDWVIMSVNGSPALGEATLSFAQGGEIAGATGCNRFRGTGTLVAGQLEVSSPLAATKMACAGAGLDAQERAILALFDAKASVAVDLFTDEVTLTNAATTLILRASHDPVAAGPAPHLGRAKPAGDPPYVSAFGTMDALQIRAKPQSDAPQVAAVLTGTVLRNAGCDGDWCAVETLDTGAQGWALRAHLETAEATLRAGQGVYDATGRLPCAKGRGAPTIPCAFGVARDGNGSATVVIAKADGVARALFFHEGAFISSDTSQAGGGFTFSVTREADLNFIRVDDERYEVPDAVILGG